MSISPELEPLSSAARALRDRWFALVAMGLIFGSISGLAYPRFDIWPAAFVSTAGLIWLARGRSALGSIGVGLVSGIAFYVSQIYWISQYLGAVPLIGLSLLEAIVFAVGFLALTLTWRLLARFTPGQSLAGMLSTAATLAAIWVTREWVSTHVPYGGFPWARLATSQATAPFANYAYWGGLPLISFAVAFVATLAILTSSAIRAGRMGASLKVTVAMALAFITPLATTPPVSAESGTLKIAAVQGNANAGLFANSVAGSIFEKHLAASRVLVAADNSSAAPDVVIWPENAVDVNPLANATAAAKLNEFVGKLNRPLILGTITQSGERYFNSSLLWLPGLGLTDQYDKKRPVPFAEYVPDRKFWASLAPDLIGLIWHDYSFGTRDGIFDLEKARLGINICFEIAVDELNRDLVDQGAQLLVSQTNNSDFGHSDETYQQAAIARLRAIETGRVVINDSTVGVTAAFLPNGKTIAELKAFKPGYLEATVPLRDTKTPAFFAAPAVDVLCALVTLLALTAYAWLTATRRKRRGGE